MHSFDSCEAGKILRIERQDCFHSVHEHGRNQVGVMHLDSRDAIIHEQSAPLFVYCQAVGQEPQSRFKAVRTPVSFLRR
jgi:hypothetical protein